MERPKWYRELMHPHASIDEAIQEALKGEKRRKTHSGTLLCIKQHKTVTYKNEAWWNFNLAISLNTPL